MLPGANARALSAACAATATAAVASRAAAASLHCSARAEHCELTAKRAEPASAPMFGPAALPCARPGLRDSLPAVTHGSSCSRSVAQFATAASHTLAASRTLSSVTSVSSASAPTSSLAGARALLSAPAATFATLPAPASASARAASGVASGAVNGAANGAAAALRAEGAKTLDGNSSLSNSNADDDDESVEGRGAAGSDSGNRSLHVVSEPLTLQSSSPFPSSPFYVSLYAHSPSHNAAGADATHSTTSHSASDRGQPQPQRQRQPPALEWVDLEHANSTAGALPPPPRPDYTGKTRSLAESSQSAGSSFRLPYPVELLTTTLRAPSQPALQPGESAETVGSTGSAPMSAGAGTVSTASTAASTAVSSAGAVVCVSQLAALTADVMDVVEDYLDCIHDSSLALPLAYTSEHAWAAAAAADAAAADAAANDVGHSISENERAARNAIASILSQSNANSEDSNTGNAASSSASARAECAALSDPTSALLFLDPRPSALATALATFLALPLLAPPLLRLSPLALARACGYSPERLGALRRQARAQAPKGGKLDADVDGDGDYFNHELGAGDYDAHAAGETAPGETAADRELRALPAVSDRERDREQGRFCRPRLVARESWSRERALRSEIARKNVQRNVAAALAHAGASYAVMVEPPRQFRNPRRDGDSDNITQNSDNCSSSCAAEVSGGAAAIVELETCLRAGYVPSSVLSQTLAQCEGGSVFAVPIVTAAKGKEVTANLPAPAQTLAQSVSQVQAQLHAQAQAQLRLVTAASPDATVSSGGGDYDGSAAAAAHGSAVCDSDGKAVKGGKRLKKLLQQQQQQQQQVKSYSGKNKKSAAPSNARAVAAAVERDVDDDADEDDDPLDADDAEKDADEEEDSEAEAAALALLEDEQDAALEAQLRSLHGLGRHSSSSSSSGGGDAVGSGGGNASMSLQRSHRFGGVIHVDFVSGLGRQKRLLGNFTARSPLLQSVLGQRHATAARPAAPLTLDGVLEDLDARAARRALRKEQEQMVRAGAAPASILARRNKKNSKNYIAANAFMDALDAEDRAASARAAAGGRGGGDGALLSEIKPPAVVAAEEAATRAERLRRAEATLEAARRTLHGLPAAGGQAGGAGKAGAGKAGVDATADVVGEGDGDCGSADGASASAGARPLRLLDCTGGFGTDVFVVAASVKQRANVQITVLERSPVLFALLADGLRRAQQAAAAADAAAAARAQRDVAPTYFNSGAAGAPAVGEVRARVKEELLQSRRRDVAKLAGADAVSDGDAAPGGSGDAAGELGAELNWGPGGRLGSRVARAVDAAAAATATAAASSALLASSASSSSRVTDAVILGSDPFAAARTAALAAATARPATATAVAATRGGRASAGAGATPSPGAAAAAAPLNNFNHIGSSVSDAASSYAHNRNGHSAHGSSVHPSAAHASAAARGQSAYTPLAQRVALSAEAEARRAHVVRTAEEALHQFLFQRKGRGGELHALDVATIARNMRLVHSDAAEFLFAAAARPGAKTLAADADAAAAAAAGHATPAVGERVDKVKVAVDAAVGDPADPLSVATYSSCATGSDDDGARVAPAAAAGLSQLGLLPLSAMPRWLRAAKSSASAGAGAGAGVNSSGSAWQPRGPAARAFDVVFLDPFYPEKHVGAGRRRKIAARNSKGMNFAKLLRQVEEARAAEIMQQALPASGDITAAPAATEESDEDGNWEARPGAGAVVAARVSVFRSQAARAFERVLSDAQSRWGADVTAGVGAAAAGAHLARAAAGPVFRPEPANTGLLLDAARLAAGLRVVIKRPRHAKTPYPTAAVFKDRKTRFDVLAPFQARAEAARAVNAVAETLAKEAQAAFVVAHD